MPGSVVVVGAENGATVSAGTVGQHRGDEDGTPTRRRSTALSNSSAPSATRSRWARCWPGSLFQPRSPEEPVGMTIIHRHAARPLRTIGQDGPRLRPQRRRTRRRQARRRTLVPVRSGRRNGRHGTVGLPFPEEYGGMGGDYFALCSHWRASARSTRASPSRSRRGCRWAPCRLPVRERRSEAGVAATAGQRQGARRVRPDRGGRWNRRRRHQDDRQAR